MADYQLAHLDLSTRIELASIVLDPFRPWGLVTQLAHQHGVSRKFLYELRDKAQGALQEALLPQPSGRKVMSNPRGMDERFVQRATVALLSIVPGTLRTAQLFLELVLGEHRSLWLR